MVFWGVGLPEIPVIENEGTWNSQSIAMNGHGS